MKIMTSLATKGALEALLPTFVLPSGSQIGLTLDPTAVMLQRIAAGERADVAILTSDGIDKLIAAGVLSRGSKIDLAVSEIGIAVKAGAPRPDISTLAAAKDALVAARSVCYARSGASGLFFADAIARHGIADAINARATIIPAGFTAERVADGTADIAVQQMSELMAVTGVDVAGPLPDGLQERLTFSGAVFAEAAEPEGAAELLRHLVRREHAAVWRAKGLSPVTA